MCNSPLLSRSNTYSFRYFQHPLWHHCTPRSQKRHNIVMPAALSSPAYLILFTSPIDSCQASYWWHTVQVFEDALLVSLFVLKESLSRSPCLSLLRECFGPIGKSLAIKHQDSRCIWQPPLVWGTETDIAKLELHSDLMAESDKGASVDKPAVTGDALASTTASVLLSVPMLP